MISYIYTMTIIEIIIIAIVEAMDCFAVSISTGLCKSQIKQNRAILQAISFGFFQGGMTLLGYFLGKFAEQWFSTIGSIISCCILSILGIKIILEALIKKGNLNNNSNNKTILSIPYICLQSIATSIDAFAVGISFAFINVNMFFATSTIAFTSFIMGILGFKIGRNAAKRFKTKIPEIIAGVILIAIGIKILL